MRRVRLNPAKRPGVLACGQYLAGKEYDVDAEEAQHLVEAKGFEYVGTAAAAAEKELSR
jgi:hypothetical protein